MANHRDYLSLNFWDLAGGGFQANDPGMEYTQGFVQQQEELENPLDSDSGLSNLGPMGNDNHSSVAGDNSYATPHSMTPQPEGREGQGVIQRSTLRTDDRSTGGESRFSLIWRCESTPHVGRVSLPPKIVSEANKYKTLQTPRIHDRLREKRVRMITTGRMRSKSHLLLIMY